MTLQHLDKQTPFIEESYPDHVQLRSCSAQRHDALRTCTGKLIETTTTSSGNVVLYKAQRYLCEMASLIAMDTTLAPLAKEALMQAQQALFPMQGKPTYNYLRQYYSIFIMQCTEYPITINTATVS